MEALKHTHLLGRHLVLEWAQDDEDGAAEVERLRNKVKEQAKALQGGDERMGKRKKLGVRDGDKRGGGDDDME
jgi:multiple RNA-binding domain-containing protein 1